jgi:hypothetical protein
MYWNETANLFVPRAEIKISCNMLTKFILNAYGQINDDNMSHCYIHNLFEIYGFSPYVSENSKLLEHLDSLSLTSAYNTLIDKQTVETLELETEE